MGTSFDQQGHNCVAAALDVPPTLTKISSLAEKRLAKVLFYSLFPNGGGFDSAGEGLDAIRGEAVTDEMRPAIDISFDEARRST